MASRDKPHSSKPSPVQLMFTTHEPLGDLQRAERALEDDYFRKLNQELLEALRTQSAAEIEKVIQQYTHGRCPECGAPLEDLPDRGASIAACPRCGGIWLNKGEWEGRVGPKAQGWLQQLFDGLLASKPARL